MLFTIIDLAIAFIVIYCCFGVYFKFISKQDISDKILEIGTITAYSITFFLLVYLVITSRAIIPQSNISINYILLVPALLTLQQLVLKVVNFDTQK